MFINELEVALPGVFVVSKFCDAMQIFFTLRFIAIDMRLSDHADGGSGSGKGAGKGAAASASAHGE